MFGFLLVPAFAALLAIGGTTVTWELPLWGAVVLAVCGFLLPDLGIHAEAASRRADFRHALGSFLDLVVIGLAGGAGVEGALSEAAQVGHGWAFARLRQALEEARLTRTPPWGPLGRLGQELGVAELSELAATVGPGRSGGGRGPGLPRRQGGVHPLPRPGRRPGRRRSDERTDEPSRRRPLRRLSPLRRLPRHCPCRGRRLSRHTQAMPSGRRGRAVIAKVNGKEKACSSNSR